MTYQAKGVIPNRSMGRSMKPTALIELFLLQLKQYVEKNSFILVEREASRRFMASRGMSMDMLTNVILSLEPEDCFDGPEADRDPRFAKKWTVAEFSPMFRGEQLNLKMSIRVDTERAKCLSVKAYIEKRDTDD